MFIGTSTNQVPFSSMTLPEFSRRYSSSMGLPWSSCTIVCLTANNWPGPVVKSHRFPILSFGLHPAVNNDGGLFPKPKGAAILNSSPVE